ncbi:MAG TPA: hypothetical protein VLV15_00845, partial [Dongiaceae bacterium]|nr:hypothetical protein [Dongiaceae bacterium]
MSRALGWVEFVDRWIPAALHRGDPVVRRRARVIVFNTVLLATYGVIRMGMELALEPFASGWPTVMVLGLGCSAGVGLTAWLWRRGDTERAAKAGMWVMIAVALSFTLAKGGMRSPGLPWFVVIPVLARACAGPRAVVSFTGYVAAFLVGCSMLD